MAREQMMAYKKQMVDYLEQAKPWEHFFKKCSSRLFCSLQRELNLRSGRTGSGRHSTRGRKGNFFLGLSFFVRILYNGEKPVLSLSSAVPQSLRGGNAV